MVRQPAVLSKGGLIEYAFDATGMDYLYEAVDGTAIRYAAEKRNLAEPTTTSWLRRPASWPARGTPARLPVSGMS